MPYPSIKEKLRLFADADESATAFLVSDGETVRKISYRQFASDVLRAAQCLKLAGITGKHITILAPESYRWCVMFYAILATGNVAVPMNPELPKEILLWQCEKTDTSLICSDAETAERLRPLLTEQPWLDFSDISSDTSLDTEDVAEIAEDDTVVLMCTSGTTGRSKVVELSAGNFCNFAAAAEKSMASEGKSLILSPIYHIGGVVDMFRLKPSYTKCFGRSVNSFFSDIPLLNPNQILTVPSFFATLSKIVRTADRPEDVSRFLGTELKEIVCVGAKLSEKDVLDFERYGIRLRIGHGMTEVTADAIGFYLDREHVTSVGKPTGAVEVRIEDGELLLRGRTLMKGYYKDPEETAKVIVDGWFHTGDLGYCDADGYYYITGRKKNVIILSNGENVNPEEIEDVLSRCPAIGECLVYSDGKGICADIYANDPAAALEYVREYNKSVPSYRRIYRPVCQSEPLPRTATGKIKRKANL